TSSPSLVPSLHLTLLRLGRQADADTLVHKWLQENPKEIEVRSYLAQRALESKQYALAANLYKEILAIQPAMPFMLNNLAWASHQAKDPKAQQYAEQANQLMPNQSSIMDTLGWILVENGDLSRGVPLLQKAVQLTPDSLLVRLHFAKALIRAGQSDAARREVE